MQPSNQLIKDLDTFTFKNFDWQATDELEVCLHYKLGHMAFSERVVFPTPPKINETRMAAFKEALQLLHWVAGISYWKATCPAKVIFEQHKPDDWQKSFLHELYQQGLAEFAYVNEIDLGPLLSVLDEASTITNTDVADTLGLRNAALVPMGGGKDSLVALEKVRKLKMPLTMTAVRPAELIQQVAQVADLPWLAIRREIDPGLILLNQQGAFNGHVPITAINMCVLLVAAIVYDFNAVVFANEASANEPTRYNALGQAVNHQYSKSLEFEQLMQAWIKRYIAADLDCFSILRPYSELGICQQFSELTQYHEVFSSCNRQFHLDGARIESRWCQICPKCLFVFLSLAVFLKPEQMITIFGSNLLDQDSLLDRYADLVGLGLKPFECIGTEQESRAAVLQLAKIKVWQDSVVVKALMRQLKDYLNTPLENFFGTQSDMSNIPTRFLSVLD